MPSDAEVLLPGRSAELRAALRAAHTLAGIRADAARLAEQTAPLGKAVAD